MKEVESDQQFGEPPTTEWKDDNFLAGLYVVMARTYDLLAVIAMHVDRAAAERVLDAHEAGKLIGDPPFLVVEVEDDES